MLDNVALAKRVLTDNTEVLYGIFGFINTSGYFPPCSFFNEFLIGGSDPCDQDGRMESWEPFELTAVEHSLILSWWQSIYPGTLEDSLNVENWGDWVQEILER
ncbi:hypothetical protein [Aliivibrio kagoshimensis]|uniref:hypothetical protein n=1 Tax=Aliivibrio kagoshimensis TaxID=2910230 RepID=UPI003D117CE4